jgi:hypothetical protein
VRVANAFVDGESGATQIRATTTGCSRYEDSSGIHPASRHPDPLRDASCRGAGITLVEGEGAGSESDGSPLAIASPAIDQLATEITNGSIGHVCENRVPHRGSECPMKRERSRSCFARQQ